MPTLPHSCILGGKILCFLGIHDWMSIFRKGFNKKRVCSRCKKKQRYLGKVGNTYHWKDIEGDDYE